jgi:hypothetical protein
VFDTQHTVEPALQYWYRVKVPQSKRTYSHKFA